MAADINPKQDPDGAYQWAMTQLEQFRARELELESLFYLLGQQITWGVIRCEDVTSYNIKATNLFNGSVDFFTWFKPLAVEIARTAGIAIAPFTEVPLPQLIGTKYIIFDRGNGHKSFDAGVTCDAAGGFSPQTPRNQLQLGPTPTVSTCLSGAVMNGSTTVTPAPRHTWSPYPTITDLRFAGFGQVPPVAPAPAPGGGWAAVALMGLKVVGVIAGVVALGRVLDFMDGTAKLKIEKESLTDVINADLRRADCANAAFLSLHGPDVADPDARFKRWLEVVASCEKLIPKRDAVKAKWWQGITGILVAGGAIVIGVALIQSRSGRSSSKEE